MSEPVTFFDINGDEVVMHSPYVAKELVAKGELFEAPPLVVESTSDEEE